MGFAGRIAPEPNSVPAGDANVLSNIKTCAKNRQLSG
jgi:hypothetical protein